MVDFHINTSLGKRYSSIEFPLIHKCDSVETILSIIDGGFRFSYSKERISDSKKYYEIAFPMISFSDLGYDKARDFLSSYGQIGIGMKKAWAQKNKISPVIYFEINSKLSSSLIEGFEILSNVSVEDTISSLRGNLIGEKHKFYKFIIEIASFSKNFYAPLFRKEKLLNSEYCFGSEREWRLILDNHDIKPYLSSKDNKLEENKKVQNHFLKFEFADIEYFIVEAEYEEEKIKKKLQEKYNKTDEEISRINFYRDSTRYEYED
jgi:hypothetical protein